MGECAIVTKGWLPVWENKRVSLLTRALAPVLRRPFGDISRELREGGGIFFQGLPEEQAYKVIDVFRAHDIAVSITPLENIHRLQRPYVFSKAHIEELYLEIEEPRPYQVLWEEVWVLGCGVVWEKPYEVPFVGREEFKIMAMERDREVRQRLKDKLLEQNTAISPDLDTAPLDTYLEIVLKDTWQRLRMERKNFRYEMLGENKYLASKQNFYQVVQRILQHASCASLTETTQIFLENHGDICDRIIFESEQNFSSYILWNCVILSSGFTKG